MAGVSLSISIQFPIYESSNKQSLGYGYLYLFVSPSERRFHSASIHHVRDLGVTTTFFSYPYSLCTIPEATFADF